jgi:hypothetical protein
MKNITTSANFTTIITISDGSRKLPMSKKYVLTSAAVIRKRMTKIWM